MHISIPKHASDIIKTLSSHGYEAFVVGGCVRDSILGKEPADWDITTSALPEQVKALFPRTIDTGLKHGTVTIMMDKVGYEVTTYRIDGTYEPTSKLSRTLQKARCSKAARFFFNPSCSISLKPGGTSGVFRMPVCGNQHTFNLPDGPLHPRA